MVRLQLTVLRERVYGSDAQFELYADLGSGQIDYAHPLGPGRVRFWPEAGAREGHLGDGHLTLRHLDSIDPDGHLETVHLWGEHLQPAWPLVMESPTYVFGEFAHAVIIFDGSGNASTELSIPSVLVNSSPEAPRCLRCVGHDQAVDQVQLSFYGSRFRPIRGL
ncbi:MAG: hypothetical protein GY842_08660 [bacterium]|nr:hypothetical protein [bacterium]